MHKSIPNICLLEISVYLVLHCQRKEMWSCHLQYMLCHKVAMVQWGMLHKDGTCYWQVARLQQSYKGSIEGSLAISIWLKWKSILEMYALQSVKVGNYLHSKLAAEPDASGWSAADPHRFNLKMLLRVHDIMQSWAHWSGLYKSLFAMPNIYQSIAIPKRDLIYAVPDFGGWSAGLNSSDAVSSPLPTYKSLNTSYAGDHTCIPISLTHQSDHVESYMRLREMSHWWDSTYLAAAPTPPLQEGKVCHLH